MFGKNAVMKSEFDPTGALRVVGGAPFFTVQGEGPFAGKGAIFLRLHGCPLRCYFCDTEFSSPKDPIMSVLDIMDAINSAAPWWCKLVVITGGEPVRQNLEPLVKVLAGSGWTIQVETSGILWQECLLDTVIVCSPKTPAIHEKILMHASAFKYVIRAGEIDPVDGLPITNTQSEGGRKVSLARPRVFGEDVYLSPMDEGNPEANRRNTEEVGRLATEFPYIAGVQLHKMFNLP